MKYTIKENRIFIEYSLTSNVEVYFNWKNNEDNCIYYLSNVGIGTENPSTKLDIKDGIVSSYTKNFKIEHPLDSNLVLYHGSVEGPRYDNIYRGKKIIKNGYGEINIDKECNTTGGMMDGTFQRLNRDYQLYLQNNETYDKIKGKIVENKILVRANTDKDLLIDWLVIGERNDKILLNSEITNNEGSLICEHNIN